MKVIVCAKWVGALGDDVEFADDGRHVDPDYLDFALNQWDACAVAEALRLRDAAGGGEVVAVSVGDETSQEALVRAIAMGADRAIRVQADSNELFDPICVARMLHATVESERPELVVCGALSTDTGHGRTGSALAALLGLPCATVATKIDYHAGKVTVSSEHEGGLTEVLEIELPAVVTIQTGIIEPAYVTMRGLQQAREALIEVIGDASPGEPACQIVNLSVPAPSQVELIEGAAPAVAARIAELVKAASG